ncbi:elongation factor Ts [Propionigenium maris DSM 9537]|uniref:Elongation factor Ts n=1 Tax=Propionigenium maris DSM 9537 TaxID=1123000 RepID=A0A9W6LNB1_9FUSO|nr:translation elongation factor Ts [Propionigenium maris]GLI56447.1 elongation factor Ts [Propionigenium maris DSM 9537]
MAAITAKMVKELREITAAGMMDCKKALTEKDGDMEAAITLLREKGMAKAAKKADRVAAEGLIFDGVSADHKTAILVEFNSETDFVAKNPEFVSFGKKLVELALANNVATAEELKAVEVDGKTVETLVTELIAKIGENMTLRKVEKITTDAGFVATYSHMGGKLCVVTELAGEANAETVEKARGIAMHVAAMNPGYLKPEDVTADDLKKEMEIARVQLLDEGKPEKIIDNILKGKERKFYEEQCLVKQVYVRAEDKETVEQFAGDNTVLSYTRVKVGEGIEKKEEDFAAEVAAQING